MAGEIPGVNSCLVTWDIWLEVYRLLMTSLFCEITGLLRFRIDAFRMTGSIWAPNFDHSERSSQEVGTSVNGFLDSVLRCVIMSRGLGP